MLATGISACGQLGAGRRGGAARGKKSEKGLDGALSPYLPKDDNVAERDP